MTWRWTILKLPVVHALQSTWNTWVCKISLQTFINFELKTSTGSMIHWFFQKLAEVFQSCYFQFIEITRTIGIFKFATVDTEKNDLFRSILPIPHDKYLKNSSSESQGGSACRISSCQGLGLLARAGNPEVHLWF